MKCQRVNSIAGKGGNNMSNFFDTLFFDDPDKALDELYESSMKEKDTEDEDDTEERGEYDE